MKHLFFLLVYFFYSSVGVAQIRFFAETSEVSFYSHGIIENIMAVNKTVTSIFDSEKGDVAFLIKIKDFQFDKKLMQIHFNEKFMESEKYPKSTFIGTLKEYDMKRQGIQNVVASGRMFIHGVTKEISVPGTLEVKGNQLFMQSKFKIKLADYNITIPQVVWQNISEEIEINVEFVYSPF